VPPAETRLVVRFAEVLDLRLREFPHAQEARARRDLVAVRLPDLRRREGQLVAVVVQQLAARRVDGESSLDAAVHSTPHQSYARVLQSVVVLCPSHVHGCSRLRKHGKTIL